MEIELVIDNREIELIKKLQIDHKITIEQLEVGDVVFRQGDETIFVIERKSVNDLKSSICDGRAREQKTRLLGNFQRDRIMYLIQGSLDLPRNSEIRGLPVGTLIASLINTQLRDGIKVYKTSSMDETVEFLKKMHDKFQKNGDTFFKDQECISATAYSSSLKKKKKSKYDN
jgi:crossover junction endonuclease MUS81